WEPPCVRYPRPPSTPSHTVGFVTAPNSASSRAAGSSWAPQQRILHCTGERRDIFRVLDKQSRGRRYDQAGMSEARRRVQSPRRSYKRPGYEALFNEACSNLDAVSHGGGG